DTLHTRYHRALLFELAQWYGAQLLGIDAEVARQALVRLPLQYLHPFDQPQRMKTFYRDELGRPELWERRLFWPLTVTKPARIFVNSMTDWLHSCVPDADVLEIVEVMRAAHWHTFQVLTKRAGRLRRLGPRIDWPPNVWVGVSVENDRFLPRVEALAIGAE